MPRDYYLILGISASASADEVHAAFRRRSKELHPDISGMESGPFLELQEAYAVLADPERRRYYDQSAAPPRGWRRVRRNAPESIVPLRSAAPDIVLRPGAAKRIRPDREVSLMNDFERFQPSFGELFDRLWSNFEAFTRPKAERIESLTVEMVASPEEARTGGRVRIGIPARVTCPECGGNGGIAGFDCWRCGGRGAVAAERSVDVEYPSGLHDGYIVRIPLHFMGIENFYLTVLFRVSADAGA